ncbi:hypothetical protein [Streptomyces sp. CC224B]|uniref:hypothetical protein n=1 Tax=Streptomyces sp. CC224B TaxID=3044571 RepID=UPI0024A92293|nr:hypothetical protein [Streptomyces sp. CC224B]
MVGDDTERTRDSRTAAEALRDVGPAGAARAQWFLGFALFGVGDQEAAEALIDRA